MMMMTMAMVKTFTAILLFIEGFSCNYTTNGEFEAPVIGGDWQDMIVTPS